MTRGKEKRRCKRHKVRDEAMEGEVEKVLGGQIVRGNKRKAAGGKR